MALEQDVEVCVETNGKMGGQGTEKDALLDELKKAGYMSSGTRRAGINGASPGPFDYQKWQGNSRNHYEAIKKQLASFMQAHRTVDNYLRVESSALLSAGERLASSAMGFVGRKQKKETLDRLIDAEVKELDKLIVTVEDAFEYSDSVLRHKVSYHEQTCVPSFAMKVRAYFRLEDEIEKLSELGERTNSALQGITPVEPDFEQLYNARSRIYRKLTDMGSERDQAKRDGILFGSDMAFNERMIDNVMKSKSVIQWMKGYVQFVSLSLKNHKETFLYFRDGWSSMGAIYEAFGPLSSRVYGMARDIEGAINRMEEVTQIASNEPLLTDTLNDLAQGYGERIGDIGRAVKEQFGHRTIDIPTSRTY